MIKCFKEDHFIKILAPDKEHRELMCKVDYVKKVDDVLEKRNYRWVSDYHSRRKSILYMPEET